MPYSRSRSRFAFESQHKKLFDLSKKVSYKSNRLDYAYKNLIFQSSIFLLSAAIEEYLKNILQDWVYELKNKGALNSDLPSNIRTLFILSNQLTPIANYNYQKDDKKVLNAISHDKLYYSITDDTKVIPHFFSYEVIIKGKKYPSVENVKSLFLRIGIPNILDIISKKANRDFKSQLESFLNVREAIAHQIPPNLTFNDVERHFDNIYMLINMIDRQLFSHIVKCSNTKFWPNNNE